MRAAAAMFSVPPGGCPSAVSIARQAERRRRACASARSAAVAVERHAAAEEEAGIVVAEHAGWRRSRSARCRRGRSRPGPGSAPAECGPTRSRPTSSMRGDRAAAGADLDHVDHRRLDRQAGAALEAVHARRLHHRRDLGAAVLDQAGLRRGAAHVERDHVGAGRRRRRTARWRVRRRPGRTRAGGSGSRARSPARRRPPAECISRSAPRKPRACSSRSQPRDVAVHQRLHVGVGAGRDRALVLAQLRRPPRTRARPRCSGNAARTIAARRLLVRRIAIGVQEADGDRLDAVGDQPLRRGAHLGGDRAA